MLNLFLGGTRSGKSELAEHCADSYGSRILYVATAENIAGEGSMSTRIQRHQERRPQTWTTLECSKNLAQRIQELDLTSFDAVMVDCITLLTSNILYAQTNPSDYPSFESALQKEIQELISLIEETSLPWILVSSETGLGLIAPNQETRNYCDGLGLANQMLAKNAENAFFCVAGRKLRLN